MQSAGLSCLHRCALKCLADIVIRVPKKTPKCKKDRRVPLRKKNRRRERYHGQRAVWKNGKQIRHLRVENDWNGTGGAF